MFYYPEVLRRHTGCFGTIWLAATCQSRLQRREYLGVDVPRTSAAVILFVTGRSGWEVPPPPPGAPPPRCSLYLAAMLQLGLARVYGRQCHLLLEEVSTILERLHRVQRPLLDIDIRPTRRPHLLPDSRALMEELEAAPDPFFGVMGVQLPQLEELLPPPEEIEALPERPLVATPESITLREPEPFLPPELPEEELPEVTLQELELLLEAEEEAPELVLPLPPRPAPPEAPPLPPVPLPPPPPPAVAPPPEAPPPRRRPRPPLWDAQTQIPAGEMRRNLSDQWGECRVREPLELPRHRRRPLKELLSTPSLGPLPPPLQELWALCAKPRPRPRPPAEEEEPTPELPSEVEVLREALEPSLALPSSEISLEPMEEEPSVPPFPAPPPEVLPEVPEAPPIDLRRLILDHAQAPEGAEFGDIVAPDWPRPRVARAFAECLDLCASHWLKLEQPRPYGPIRIRLRPRRQ